MTPTPTATTTADDGQQSEAPQPTPTARPRILTTYAKKGDTVWLSRVEPLPGRTWDRPEPESLPNDLKWAWKLFRASRDYDVVATGSDRMSRIFATLQFFFRRRKVPHLYIKWICSPHGGRLKRWLYRTELRWAVLGASRAIVQGKHEITAHAEELGVPVSKFVFLPYHSTLYDFRYQVEEGDYIFAGGDSNRDYPTLIEAVRGLPYRVVISVLSREHFRGIQVPPNVEIVTLSSADYYQKMAGAALVVVPMLPRLAHSGGQQTWINAMIMGKPVIVAEDRSACDYIAHESTGWLAEPGNPSALRKAICLLLENRTLAGALGEKAKEAAKQFSKESHFEGVFRVIDECLQDTGASPARQQIATICATETREKP
jgi:glycosyltransferase involved in cell wall biosynthesis